MVTRGFSTLEILIALAIVSTTLISITLLTLGMPSVLASTRAHREALAIARADLARAEAIGQSDFGAARTTATTTTNGYTHNITATNAEEGALTHLSSTVSWISDMGRAQSITLSTVIADYMHPRTSSCDSFLSGNWQSPTVLSYTLAPGSLLPAVLPASTYSVSSLAVSGTFLFITANATGNKTDPTFFIFDITDRQQPQYLGSLDNAPTIKTGGISAVAVSGSYAYAASSVGANFTTCTVGQNCAQLQIIDIHTPSAPTIAVNFKLPTASVPFALGSGGQSSGKTLIYENGLLYLGLTKTGSSNGEEFTIVDVQDPLHPVLRGGYTVGRTINAIATQGRYAYLATDDTALEPAVLDTSDPTHLTLAGSYHAAGFGYGEALAQTSTRIFLARSYTTTAPELAILDSSAAPTLTLLGGADIDTAANPVSAQAVLVRDFLAFVLAGTELQLWRVDSPATPTAWRAPLSLPHTSTGIALTCRGNTLYAASVDSDGMSYLTVLTGS